VVTIVAFLTAETCTDDVVKPFLSAFSLLPFNSMIPRKTDLSRESRFGELAITARIIIRRILKSLWMVWCLLSASACVSGGSPAGVNVSAGAADKNPQAQYDATPARPDIPGDEPDFLGRHPSRRVLDRLCG
jgi:hypothetical protein